MQKQEAYVYILQDKSGKFYTGSTPNLMKRLNQHSQGHTQTTRNMRDFRLVISQKFPSLQVARKVEYKLKKLKRKDYIEKIVSDGYIRIAG